MVLKINFNCGFMGNNASVFHSKGKDLRLRIHNKGTPGNKGGRPSKAEHQALAERLSPLDDMVFNALKRAIKARHYWSVKLFFQYCYGRPKEIRDTNLFVEQPLFIDFKD